MELSIYTPTFRRPSFLAVNRRSVADQSVTAEHIVVKDEIGLGVGGMYADIKNHAHMVTGDYVAILPDDCLLLDRYVVEDFGAFIVDQPVSVVMWRSRLRQSREWYPLDWHSAPQLQRVDVTNFVIERTVWLAYAASWSPIYAADYHFIRQLWDDGLPFAWFDRQAVVAAAQMLGSQE